MVASINYMNVQDFSWSRQDVSAVVDLDSYNGQSPVTIPAIQVSPNSCGGYVPHRTPLVKPFGSFQVVQCSMRISLDPKRLLVHGYEISISGGPLCRCWGSSISITPQRSTAIGSPLGSSLRTACLRFLVIYRWKKHQKCRKAPWVANVPLKLLNFRLPGLTGGSEETTNGLWKMRIGSYPIGWLLLVCPTNLFFLKEIIFFGNTSQLKSLFPWRLSSVQSCYERKPWLFANGQPNGPSH